MGLLTKLNDKIYKIFNGLNTLKNECKNIISHEINSLIAKLSVLTSKLNINETNNNKLISLYNQNIKINDQDELDNHVNSILKLKWGNREFKIMIIK
jgi:hypothetical protein